MLKQQSFLRMFFGRLIKKDKKNDTGPGTVVLAAGTLARYWCSQIGGGQWTLLLTIQNAVHVL